MMDFRQFSALQEKINPAQTIYIFLPSDPQFDQVAAGLGFYLSLTKAGKAVNITCPKPMVVKFSSLVGVDKIGTELQGNQLVVSFDYVEDSLEKVSYNVENGKFNLVIQAKDGYPPLSASNVHYSYSGGLRGLVITIDVPDPASLGHFYDDNQALFAKDNVYNLDKEEAASISEKVAGLISYIKLPIDQDIATNLVLGITEATKNFTHPLVDADTFEAMAFCLRAGGRRMPRGETRKMSKKQTIVSPQDEGFPPKSPSPDWLQPKVYKGNTRI